MSKSREPICLTVAGLDPSGGAGIIADIKTFSAFGCFPTAAVASLTFQNTLGVFGASNQTAETVRKQVQPIIDDFGIDAIKTGMLPTREVIAETALIIRENGLRNIVVDPVVRSTSGFDLIDNKALRAIIEDLFPLADLITPNIPEAERITGVAIESDDDILAAAAQMRKFGARNVLIKGGHGTIADSQKENDLLSARDFLFLDDELHIFESEYLDTTATHGTGCTLAAAITANLALGKSLKESVEIAKAFVHRAIVTAPGHGKGNSPINIKPI
jgi:hydroxymethylpyrimidine kinase/phosphomethylpyrimidine kinase